MDWEHQRNKTNKGHSEKIELNERGLRREGTILKDEHIRKDIPTLYNSWTNNIYTQPPPYNYIWQQQTTREYAKTLHPSSFWTKEPGYMLGGCNRRGFQFFEQLRFKTLQLFVPNSKRLIGNTLGSGTTTCSKLLLGRTNRTRLHCFLQRTDAVHPRRKSAARWDNID